MPILIGTTGLCGSLREHARAFPVAEIQPGHDPPLTISTAQRWRGEAPEAFEFTVRASKVITHPPPPPRSRRRRGRPPRPERPSFQDTPEVRKAWKATLEIARALEASTIVFPTPTAFYPTDTNIENLIRFFQWAHRDRITLGWEPRGDGWTDAVVRELCRELSLTHVVDPLQRGTMRARPPYFRVHGPGSGPPQLSDDDLDALCEACAEPLTYVIFDHACRETDAARLARRLERCEAATAEQGVDQEDGTATSAVSRCLRR